MKNFKKGFTLVEMLIVVVIIGILAAAILPRLQGAQAATRDVAREKGLGDISAAIEMYAAALGEYPEDGTSAKSLKDKLVDERAYIKEIPTDPKKNQTAVVLWDKSGETAQYTYKRIKRNGTLNGAYILAAKVETIDKANAVEKMLADSKINQDTDFTTFKTCSVVKKLSSCGTNEGSEWPNNSGECCVANESELRFVFVR